MLTATVFAVGLTAGALLAPTHSGGTAVTAPQLTPESNTPPADNSSTLRAAYPAEVLRVFDGDTFEARVRIWPQTDVTTRVRLRGIDTPEMRGRCEDERIKAVAAREALARILAQGGVGIANVGLDKYGGRIDADASTAGTPDVSAALRAAGHARAYSGAKRQSWCVSARER